MTGFATSTTELYPSPDMVVHATMTIKTLNSKFFEATCRLPHVLAHLEQPIIQRCKDQLKRGSVTVTVHLSNSLGLRSEIAPSLSIAQSYVSAIQKIQSHCGLAGTVTVQDIIQLPHIFESNDNQLNPAINEALLKQLHELLTIVATGRAKEGKSLQNDLEDDMRIINACVEELAPRAEIVSQERRDRFAAELAAALSTAPADVRDHHIQALYQQLNAIDIHEEVVRLRTHQENFLATLASPELQKGKRLDFILQELFREINTLSAKLADTASINAILTVKTKLEHAREQVQNIV